MATNAAIAFTGPSTVCALTAAGEADCWGSSPAELIGPAESGCTGCVRTPRAVATAYRFRRLSVGSGHICGVIADSTAVCWGRGTEGQLGNGGLVTSSTPTPVAGGLRFADIAAGESYTCGITAAGVAYCWGANNRGQLGDSTQATRSTPVRVRFPGAFRAIDVGSLTTCGVSTTGAPFCWGRTDGRITATDSAFFSRTSVAPVPVELPTAVRVVDIGLLNLCAIGQDDVTRCWGWGTHGETGPTDETRCRQASVELYCFPGRIDAPTLTEVHVGVYHACGRARDGAIYCWGGNFHLGAGGPTYANQPTPQRIGVP
ncbi:RCC1 domain-containing protein [Gemmatirosa kalamazoonensis]|uniref:RCC1 domain-containing protein n=1 Tax=Gemmatirosa kalamazoonensis TaxID=861299 RepID=UPI00046CF626|nr:hypothetical protein [Gemmatirosa kalamazoonensis]